MLPAILLVRVLVLTAHESPEPSRFVQLLDIQLTGIAQVERGTRLVARSAAAKISSAARAADERNANLAVWIERAEAAESGQMAIYSLHVVGRREGRLLVQVLRVPARDGPDLDRLLALKVGEVLDGLLRTAAEPTLRVATEWVGTPPAPQRAGIRPWLEFGLRGSSILSTGDALLGLGVAGGVQWPATGLETYAAVRGETGLDETSPAGQVEADELAAALGGRMLAQIGPVAVGGGMQFALRRLRIQGTTVRGKTGQATGWIPSVAVGGEARLGLSRWLAIRAALSVDYATIRASFTVNDELVLDLGRVRPVAELSLVFSNP
jgi:hypothetical protein